MARIAKPLTNTEVKQAKSKPKVYTLSDGGGLQLRVNPSGSKKWLFAYQQPHSKKRTSITLGTYPSLTLAGARIERQKATDLLVKSIDPQEHRDELERANEAAHANTLEYVASQWLKVKKAKVSTDHAADTWRSLELHIFPKMGKLPIHKITAVKAIETIKPIAAKGSLETVKRLCQRLNEVMNFAVNSGVINTNPLAGISAAFEAPNKQHMPTLKPEQLPELMRSIATANIKRTTRCLIEWQLHTIVRPSEAAGTRWDEIDLETRLWTIPAERMKKKKEHIVPLSEQSVALLEAMKPISAHREFVFPADRNPRSHANPSTANMALKRMGFDGLLVAHGLRALASTTLNEQGFDPDVIEAALAHIDKNEVRKAYNRAQYLEQRQKLMTWWSDHIQKASTGDMSMANGNKGLRIASS